MGVDGGLQSCTGEESFPGISLGPAHVRCRSGQDPAQVSNNGEYTVSCDETHGTWDATVSLGRDGRGRK